MRTWKRNIAAHSPFNLFDLGLVFVSKDAMANEKVKRDKGAVWFEASPSKVCFDLIDIAQVEPFSFAVFWLRDDIVGELEMIDPLALRVNKATLADLPFVCDIDVCDVANKFGILADSAFRKTSLFIGLSDNTFERILPCH